MKKPDSDPTTTIVVSFKTAKALKRAGWEFETWFWYDKDGQLWSLPEATLSDPQEDVFFAPTAQELTEQLDVVYRISPASRSSYLILYRGTRGWSAKYEADGRHIKEPNMAEAAAALYLELNAHKRKKPTFID